MSPRRNTPVRIAGLLATIGALAAASGATGATPPPSPVPTGPDVPPAAFLPSAAENAADPYVFARPGDARTVELTRTPEGVHFAWPRMETGWDTALVAVESWGAEQAPWIEVAAGDQRIQQWLDPYAVGVRWINLSGLRERLKAGTDVVLRTHAVTLAGRTASLRVFDNHLDLGARILVIAPHPDDAEIAAFGLYADRQTSIVTLTPGNAGDMNFRARVSDPAAHYALKGYLRAVDSVTVPWQGNVRPERTANLGYFDGRLDAMYLAPEQPVPEVYGPNTDVAPYRRANLSTLVPKGSRSNSWQHLVEDLVTVLREVEPALIVMPDPRLDTHLDHEFASVAVDEALGRWPGNPVFLLYTNHTDENLYPYGPADTAVSLPTGDTRIALQGVYSHPVPPALRTRKLFALESMHDLRLSPDEQLICNLPDAPHRPDYPREEAFDYLRRALRTNELFLRYDKAGMHAVIQDFLAAFKAAQPAATGGATSQGPGGAATGPAN